MQHWFWSSCYPTKSYSKVKVDATDKFGDRPTKVKPSMWLTEVERWLRLCQIPWEAMVDSTASRLSGGALTWVDSCIANAERRGQPTTKMMWWRGRSRGWTWLIHLVLG